MVGAAEEAGVAALGRPREEEEGVALGRPKDGEGNLESEGKPLMCSLSTGKEKQWKKFRLWQNKRQLYKLQKRTWNSAIHYNCCNNKAEIIQQ